MKLVVVGHGKFASGIKESIKLLYGLSEEMYFLDFTEEKTPDKFKSELETVINETTIIFCDVVGGTPFNKAVEIKYSGKDVEVIGGVNIPMILSFITEKNELKREEVVDFCIESGRNEINSFRIIKKLKNNDTGI